MSYNEEKARIDGKGWTEDITVLPRKRWWQRKRLGLEEIHANLKADNRLFVTPPSIDNSGEGKDLMIIDGKKVKVKKT